MSDDQTPPMARPRVAAGALLFDEQGRVLLVEPTYKDGWDIPGGYVEPGETPLEACRREVKEELGIEALVTRLLVADWAPSATEGDKLLFVFEAQELSAAAISTLTLPEDELLRIDFFARDELGTALNNRLQPRIAEAVHARSLSGAVYLESGRRPGASETSEAPTTMPRNP